MRLFWTIFKHRASTRAISIVLPKRRAKVQFHRNAHTTGFLRGVEAFTLLTQQGHPKTEATIS